jgi:hypothetical protein
MKTNEQVLNRVFSCSAGHYKIWNMIAESNEPGVVLEHDAIVKQDYTNLQPKDGEILWLGPRIDRVDDYNYPQGVEETYQEIDRYEGTHAYAITANTAKQLLASLKTYGLNDSIDGQLGMRNMFDMSMVTIDPPMVVAVVGTRQSTIDNLGFWNAYHTEWFLKCQRRGAKLAPIRKLVYSNTTFLSKTDELQSILETEQVLDNKPRRVLVIEPYEGLSSVWLSNKLLTHDMSEMYCTGMFRGTSKQKEQQFPNEHLQQICSFNTYFSKYYYKISVIGTDKEQTLLIQSISDPDVRFDVIYIDGNTEVKEVIFNGILASNLLNIGGLIIFDEYKNPNVKTGVHLLAQAIDMTVTHRDEFASLRRL